jgi:hypothetical protein
LSITRNDTKKSKSRKLLILSGYSFEGNIIKKGFIRESSTTTLVDNMDDWIHWTDCIGPEFQQLLNTSYGSVIDQSPVRSA